VVNGKFPSIDIVRFSEVAVKPKLLEKSNDDTVLSSIISCISGIECSKFFLDHLSKSQSDQRLLVANFQAFARSKLAGAIQDVEWVEEHCPSQQNRDSIDIFGNGDGFVVVIELDKNRADQVAKKFVSRMALLPSTMVYFVTLCYPGTERMSKSECKKYFGYCSVLARRMGCHYAGFIIG